MISRFIFIIPLLVFSILFFFFNKGLQQDPRLLPSTLIHKPAPTFQLAALYSPKIYHENIFLGHPTLFNVWASWCDTCQEEQTALMKIHQKYPEIQIIGLNEKDQAPQARAWLKRYGNPYKIILVDPQGLTAIDYGVYGTPETFLIDSTGIILAKQVGALSLNL